MNDPTLIKIGGTVYRKSLSSAHGGNHCVGVASKDGTVSVINTKSHGAAIQFTLAEWKAFLEGVKAGEFDPERLPQ